jgi:hypothetical protein
MLERIIPNGSRAIIEKPAILQILEEFRTQRDRVRGPVVEKKP